jgi:hypothetical protein
MTVRPLLVLVAVLIASLAAVPAVEAKSKKPKRQGGHVEKAWPATKRGKPSNRFAQSLARQVGPLTPPKATKARKAGTASAAAVSATNPLQLVRSFDIPTDDPSYARLLNTSFTYDSGVAAAGFVALRSKAQAEQLLDQLKALQRTDGSIDYAFNVYTGASDPSLRSGTIAWAGLGATSYGKAYGGTKYASFASKIATWLTSQQRPDGLIKGGPDVAWVSTQHNLLAYFFFRAQADLSSGSTAKGYDATADKIAAGIDANLIKPFGTNLYFQQGLADTTHPLDTQTLGILYLKQRGRTADAGKVADYIGASFSLANRSIVKSTVPATFNNTYSAPGPFIGYRPYADDGAPDVLWMEGTLQARFALSSLGRATDALDNSIASWYGVTGDGAAGPLMADKTVTTNRFNEYHVWPVSATTSWTLLIIGTQTTFVAN